MYSWTHNTSNNGERPKRRQGATRGRWGRWWLLAAAVAVAVGVCDLPGAVGQSASNSYTPAASVSNTASLEPSVTPSFSPSCTPTISPSTTPSMISPSTTPTTTSTATVTPSMSGAPSYTASVSPTATISNTQYASLSISISNTRTVTVTVTNTISNSNTMIATVSNSETVAPTVSVTATVSNTVSNTMSVTPTYSNSGSISKTVTNSMSVTATCSPTLPSPSPTVTPFAVATAALAVSVNTVTGDLDGVLVARGSGLSGLCSDVSRLEAWTAAPLLATPTCNESTAVAVYNASADTGVWLWYGSSQVAGLSAFSPDRSHPSIITATPALAWGAVLNVNALGIGTAGVTGVALGPSRLPCIEVAVVGSDTVTCRLRFLSSALLAPGAAVTVWVTFSGAAAAVSAGVIASPPVAPLLTGWQLPAFLPRGGGALVNLTLPLPAWTATEVAALPSGAAGSEIQLMLLNPSDGGAYASAPCTVVNSTQVTCPSPPGHGLGVHIMLVLNNILNVSVPTGGAGGQPVVTAAYLPPVLVAVAPSYVALPPPSTATPYLYNLTLTADTVADLGSLVNITLNDGPCTAVSTISGTPTLTCTGWDGAAAARRAAAAAPDANTYPLTGAFWWGGAYFAGAPAPLSTLILRPIVTRVTPTSVTPGGALIVIGDNLCPNTGCDDTRPDSQVVVRVGPYSCTAASTVSRTVATCTVPSVSAADANYPVYNVSVANGLGSVAGGQQPTITYPSTAYVRTTGAPSLWFIPGDASVPWLVNGTVEVELVPAGTVVAYNGNITCSLTPITPSVLLLPRERASLLDIVGEGRVSFGAFAIQAPFTLAAVTMSAACTTLNSDYTSTESASLQLLVTPLRVRLCTTLPVQSQSQVTLPTWALALALAGGAPPTCDVNGSWTGPPLPTIICTVSVDTTTSTVQPALVGGSATLSTSSGMAVFDGTSVGGSVDSDVTLAIACAIGSVAIPDTLRHTVRITGCAPGSAPQGSLCVPCTAVQYSEGGAGACHSCPHEGAVCSGGVLTLLPGFYRPPSQAGRILDAGAELHTCALPAGCVVNNTGRAYGCASGYTGALCGVCDAASDYSRIGDVCVVCPPSAASKFMLAAGVIVALIAIGVFVLRAAGRKKSEGSIALRILLTHVQALGALRTFAASGTALYKQVMSWADVLSPAIVSQGPAQCVMRPAFMSVFLATLTAPVLVAGAGLAILTIFTAGLAARENRTMARWRYRTRSELAARCHERRPMAILLFVAHLAYMPITTAAINVFKCTPPVDGTRYLATDLRVSCKGSTYVAAASIAGAVLAFFSLGFPLLVYFILSTASPATLANPHFLHAWGFLYSGYRYTTNTGKEVAAGDDTPGTPSSSAKPTSPLSSTPTRAPVAVTAALAPPRRASATRLPGRVTGFLLGERHSLVHWESLVLLRKAGIVLISTLLTDPLTQVATVSLMMMAFLAAHLRLLPYAAPFFNLLDAASMSTIIVTATLCVVSAEVATSPASSAYLGITILMLAINLAALLLFATTCVTRTAGAALTARREARALRKSAVTTASVVTASPAASALPPPTLPAVAAVALHLKQEDNDSMPPPTTKAFTVCNPLAVAAATGHDTAMSASGSSSVVAPVRNALAPMPIKGGGSVSRGVRKRLATGIATGAPAGATEGGP